MKIHVFYLISHIEDHRLHVPIMNTREATQYGSKETQRNKLLLYLYSLHKTVSSFVISI